VELGGEGGGYHLATQNESFSTKSSRMGGAGVIGIAKESFRCVKTRRNTSKEVWCESGC